MNVINRKRKVALAGLGDIAHKVYLPLLAHHEKVEVAGVMSRSEATVQRVTQTYRFPQGTTDLEELLSWDLDAVFVHSPTETHYDMVKACLERGISVYVDKPLTTDLAKSRELAALASKKGLLLAVGFNRRFAPLYVRAKAWVEETGGFVQAAAAKHRTTLQKGSSSDTIYDDLIHMLDLLLWLGGSDYELLHHHLSEDEQGRLLHTSGELGLGRNVTGRYSMIRQAGADMEKLELHGSGRSAEIVNLERAVLCEHGRPPETREFGSWEPILHRRGFSGAVDHFLEHLASPEDCTIRAERVMRSHELASRLAEQQKGGTDNG
ncbi:Gfo/Idh/MocA family oxidoreductase [Paenibacillus sp. SSG-1]|uniref:Gfo/Idh/MocA family protein n=1 Tax=Paenibacillus sp. SSG-1 TaxID=1443669 RepID=UPI0015C58845|nr:Gfo/Idh/MocA family oxidoreductase [Paenibacillus sp. SSG-1]